MSRPIPITELTEEAIECWDDDDDLQADDFQLRSTSLATNTSSSFAANSRDSISSRLSLKSETESNAPGDESHTQVVLPGDDEKATVGAITSAINAGIPIPKNVPSSALLGGTIKRLGGKKTRKVIGDDWGEDLELPGAQDGGLQIRTLRQSDFPDALRQVSGDSATTSPAKQGRLNFRSRMELRNVDFGDGKLNRFRDGDDDLSFADVGDVPTIRVAKQRASPQKLFSTAPATLGPDTATDDFEMDLEFPDTGEPLKLATQKETPRTPAVAQDGDFDDWADGSLGTRYGGTRREGRSNRSSSVSGLSPSISSSLTIESEDEGLDGLELPTGPVNFEDILKKRKENESPDPANYSGERQAAKRAAAKDDFFSGIEIGDGDVFDAGKLTLNRNIKHKAAQQPSPAGRTALSLTFTNKSSSTATTTTTTSTTTTRIPRLVGGIGAPPVPTLEPVSENGLAPVRRLVRPASRAGHSAQSSVSSVPTPTTPSSVHSMPPLTPSRRRGLESKPSIRTLREPTTTSAQLLKVKRSLPVLRSNQISPSRPITYSRPPSQAEHSNSIPTRPKTPLDRYDHRQDASRKPPVPFLPAGSSTSQSHHISAKRSRQFMRHDSESSITSSTSDISHATHPSQFRSVSRATRRSPSPRKKDGAVAPESLRREAAATRTLTRPTKKRNFGDGSELEVFDDLPTSATLESKFVKLPIGRGAPKALRGKASSISTTGRNTPETFSAPHSAFLSETPRPSPLKQEFTPRFARDTNASRNAREQRIASTTIAPTSTNWKAQVAARAMMTSPHKGHGHHHKRKNVQQTPHLIKPLGNQSANVKTVKGMTYNPDHYRWEGNEAAVASFETITNRDKAPTPTPPRPALITNINATKGFQVVGGMVFDPQQMRWLKTAPDEDEDDDPFANIEDLDDGTRSVSEHNEPGGISNAFGSTAGEWLVGEEFDVGPEFVRRQREEEDRWRRKVQGWVGHERDMIDAEDGPNGRGGWRWGIWELVSGR